MVMAKPKYEELRAQRLEENRKRMEELHLPLLSQALNTSPKPSPMKRTPTKPRIVREHEFTVRRSNRVANKPVPDYNESATFERIKLPRSIRIDTTRRDLLNRVYAEDEARAYATTKAVELELSLGSDYPTLVRPMLPSHVTGGFWLGVPVHFKKYLPGCDETVTLVDEEGEEYPVIYLARKSGLSGGWKGFAVDHKLVDGDAVVFQVIRPTVLKAKKYFWHINY